MPLSRLLLRAGQDLREVHRPHPCRCRAMVPPMCIRQELSAAHSTSAPVDSALRTLSAPIAAETSAFFTREGAAEAAALLGARQLAQLQPLDRLEQPPRPVAEAEHRAARGRSGGR